MKIIESSTRENEQVTVSVLNLIDLAGSEKASSIAERRKEGAFINKSLLTLGTVIAKLSESPQSQQHIPYRDSKLTRMLQHSLSGNAKISVICTISPVLANMEESHSTLVFAERVKKVTVAPEVNSVLDEKALLKQYEQEISELKKQLASSSHENERFLERQKSLLEEEKLRYEVELKEQQLIKDALKERIDHLTRLIISSSTPVISMKERKNASLSYYVDEIKVCKVIY